MSGFFFLSRFIFTDESSILMSVVHSLDSV